MEHGPSLFALLHRCSMQHVRRFTFDNVTNLFKRFNQLINASWNPRHHDAFKKSELYIRIPHPRVGESFGSFDPVNFLTFAKV